MIELLVSQLLQMEISPRRTIMSHFRPSARMKIAVEKAMASPQKKGGTLFVPHNCCNPGTSVKNNPVSAEQTIA